MQFTAYRLTDEEVEFLQRVLENYRPRCKDIETYCDVLNYFNHGSRLRGDDPATTTTTADDQGDRN